MTAFDPWTSTFEDAMKLQQACGDDSAPTGPLFQWSAVQWLTDRRHQIEVGTGFDVLQAVAECARCGLVMPDWLVSHFLRRYRAVQQLETDSWDDPAAFGRPYPKGGQLARLRQRRSRRLAVWNLVQDFVRRNPESAIEVLWRAFGASATEQMEVDAATAAKVRLLGLGKTLAQELYAEAVSMGFHTHSAARASLIGSRQPARLGKLAGMRRRR